MQKFLNSDFKELLIIIEQGEKENVFLYKTNQNEDKFNIISKQCNEVPNIVFRFTEDTLVLSNIYIKNKGIGTGTKVIGWLINYAIKKEMSFFKITIIDKNNFALKNIGEKYNMKVISNGENVDFILKL